MLESELTAPQIACNISHSHVVTWCVYGGSVFVFLCVRFSILTNVQNVTKNLLLDIFAIFVKGNFVKNA